jgi:hypothetical protein
MIARYEHLADRYTYLIFSLNTVHKMIARYGHLADRHTYLICETTKTLSVNFM